MSANLWIDLLLAASLALTAATLAGYLRPELLRARDRFEVLRRHGVAALVCYLLMALLLSVHVIDRRGYDTRFEHASAPSAVGTPASRN